jgi:hypothetical protein
MRHQAVPAAEARRREQLRGIIAGVLAAPIVVIATWSLFVLLSAAGGPR